MSQVVETTRTRGGDRPDLSIAVPCYNEELSVRGTAEQLVQAFRAKQIDFELVLVDNGSSDATGAVIDAMIEEGLPIRKVLVRENQGYGHGVLSGLEACQGEFIGFTCADAQVEAHDVVRLYEVLAHSSTPKLVKVRRRFRMDGLKRKVVSIVYNVFANVLFGGLRSIDINGNPKLLPREYYERMNLRSKDWFLDAEVMLGAKRLRLPVFEMNVIAQMRGEGVSNVRSSTIVEFLRNLFRWRVKPDRVSSKRRDAASGAGRSNVEIPS